MFNPKYPAPDTAPTADTSLVQPLTALAHLPACDCNHTPAPVPAPVPASRPGVQLTPGALIATVAGGTAAVLVVGAVLVSMLLAVAVTAVSIAICAVVLRSLLSSTHKDR
ncbi:MULTISPECIES: SpdD protein [unclassified Streptomyces]|uniref:SpdD protein n=1 Tax=unclassified Streptomyces TaxID=2593676 RepID=UPI002E772B57|nr:SpdD protein [Streptomyces sp. JV184]MEE1749126.1 SpdD protein [Streptomyces sp. JV184]